MASSRRTELCKTTRQTTKEELCVCVCVCGGMQKWTVHYLNSKEWEMSGFKVCWCLCCFQDKERRGEGKQESKAREKAPLCPPGSTLCQHSSRLLCNKETFSCNSKALVALSFWHVPALLLSCCISALSFLLFISPPVWDHHFLFSVLRYLHAFSHLS